MRKLGKYNVKQEIGRGGMARVYLAHHARKPFAIKVLREEAARDATFVERFRREAAILKGLEHPNIVTLRDFDDEGERLFLVMDYVKGESLAERLERKVRLPLAAAWDLMEEILSALDYAHDQGVIHRDIKPENVLLDEEGHAQITDFGIAAAESSDTLTQTGTRLGTPSYMAPEQIRGQHRLRPQADLYSAGVLFYEMLSGRLPFAGADVFAIGYQHACHYPEPLRRQQPEIPEALDRLILEALEKQAEDRPASAKLMLRSLREIRKGGRPEIPLSWDPTSWQDKLSVVVTPGEGEDGEKRVKKKKDKREEGGAAGPVGSPLPSLLRLGLFLMVLALVANFRTPSQGTPPGRGPAPSIARDIARLESQRLALVASARLERGDLPGALVAFQQAMDKDQAMKINVVRALETRCLDEGKLHIGQLRELAEFFARNFPDEASTSLLSARMASSEGKLEEARAALIAYCQGEKASAEVLRRLFAELPASRRFELATLLDADARARRMSDPRTSATLNAIARTLRPGS